MDSRLRGNDEAEGARNPSLPTQAGKLELTDSALDDWRLLFAVTEMRF